MDEGTTGPRTCEVCGGPLGEKNRVGVCRSTPECGRERDRRRRRASGARPLNEAARSRETLPGYEAERWLPVPGWEGLYDVSDMGRVRSLPRQTSRGVRGGRILKPARSSNGYLFVGLSRNSKVTYERVHRLVAGAFIGPCPPGQEAKHKRADLTNNRATNLEYGTHKSNIEERDRDGNHPNGSKTHCPYKHEYTPDNTRIQPGSGGRTCLLCERIRGMARTRKGRALLGLEDERSYTMAELVSRWESRSESVA